MTNGVFKKHKALLCVMGNQQKEGVHYQLGGLYAPVMKAAEVRLFVAMVATQGLNLMWAAAARMWAAADEEYVRFSTGRPAMACTDLDMDGKVWIHCGEQ